MDNAVYLTLSHQLALLQDLDATSNNVANTNTGAFQASHTLFDSYLLPNDGRGKIAFPHDIATYRSMDAGGLTSTGNQFDLAINGEGYFVVQTPAGPRYTRAGNFKVDAAGTLVSSDGYPVLDIGGQTIHFNPEDHDLTIGSVGNISVNGEERGQIDVVTFDNPSSLQRVGAQLYSTDASPQPALDARVVQGTLEGSNVQPVIEMTHLIDISRAMEESNKFVQIMYDLESKSGDVWTQQLS